MDLGFLKVGYSILPLGLRGVGNRGVRYVLGQWVRGREQMHKEGDLPLLPWSVSDLGIEEALEPLLPGSSRGSWEQRCQTHPKKVMVVRCFRFPVPVPCLPFSPLVVSCWPSHLSYLELL